jgi:hypothetical protein
VVSVPVPALVVSVPAPVAPPPPPAAPAPSSEKATTYMNNGSVSCSVYCAGIAGNPWNGELPRSWNGASCVGTGTPGVGCGVVNGWNQIDCVCSPTGEGWNPDAAPWNNPVSPVPWKKTPPAAAAPPPPAAIVCQTTPLISGGCVNACNRAFGSWANGDNKVNLNSPGNGGICSCRTPSGCSLPPGFTQ